MDGKRLIDLHLNGETYNLGHRNLELIATLESAVRRFDIGKPPVPAPTRTPLAEALVKTCPPNMRRVIYGASGGEAPDIAIKTARHTRQKRKIVSVIKAYRWSSPASSVVATRSPRCCSTPCRAPQGSGRSSKGSLRSSARRGVAASSSSVNGVTTFRLAYGGAHELCGLEPNLVTLGKLIGGGFTVGGFGGRAEIMALFAPGEAGGSTANPVAAWADLAALDGWARARVDRDGRGNGGDRCQPLQEDRLVRARHAAASSGRHVRRRQETGRGRSRGREGHTVRRES